MKHIIVALTAVFSFAVQAQVTGAGASFPAPVYFKWAEQYRATTGNAVNYASIGSSGGIKQIDSKTVDFGASDDPRKPDQVADKGQFQFPTVIGGVVPIVNIKGVEPGKMVLDGPTLADIFEGKITKWNDSAIAKLNPSIKLPATAITVVVRADGSGTTAVFTDYLAMVSASFKDTTGAGKKVKWKASTSAGKGNAGVAAFVKQLDGAIGYVEYAYVKQNNMTYTLLKNRKGQAVAPNGKSFSDAAAGADWKVPGMAVNLNNLDGWPITAATFVLVYKNDEKSAGAIKFFDWAFSNGDRLAVELDYVPLPSDVKAQIRKDWRGAGF